MNTSFIALKLLTPDEDFFDIKIGTCHFTDDVWNMSDYIERKTLSNSSKLIRFGYIQSGTIKTVVKQYAYYKLGKVKAQTVAHYVNSILPTFIRYCELNHIESLEQISFSILSDYCSWAKDEKGRNESSCHKDLLIISEIVRVGQIKGWRVTSDNFLSRVKLSELLVSGDPLSETRKAKPIPNEVFNKIMNIALSEEQNVLTKAGIIIQSQTGLRISEVLGIKKGCLSTTSEGFTFLEVQIGKTVKGEPVIHKVYANDLVKGVVFELEQATEHLREASGLQELFLYKHNGVCVLKIGNWTYTRLDSFIRRWDIRDKEGMLYPLKSHQFRATFVRELIKQNVSINHIMKQFAHVSIAMTMHYLVLQENEIREIYTEMLFRPDSKIAGIRAETIKNALEPHFKGKTASEIDEFISDLAETMSFNPLPNGICLYDFRRGNCTNGDGCFFYNCPNYITEIQFYPILKRELDLIELEMERYKALGRERDWQRQSIKHRHLKELVSGLEVQLNG